MNNAIDFEDISLEELKSLLKPMAPPVFKTAQDPFKALRKKEVSPPLADYAVGWMSRLPRHVQPRVTAHRYARIVNKLASLWEHPQKCETYLLELLVDRRGSRQGFPADVALELRALSNYFHGIGAPTDVWSHEFSSRR